MSSLMSSLCGHASTAVLALLALAGVPAAPRQAPTGRSGEGSGRAKRQAPVALVQARFPDDPAPPPPLF